jgi:hypothetical protein
MDLFQNLTLHFIVQFAKSSQKGTLALVYSATIKIVAHRSMSGARSRKNLFNPGKK